MSADRSSRYSPAPYRNFNGRDPVVDLHLHTTASDGLLTPAQLIDRIANTSLRVIAITDHDTTNGIDEATEAAAPYPHLTVLPGIELGTEDGPSEVHLLGYFIDHNNAGFQATLENFRLERVEAARKSVEKLNSMGVKISWERVRELAGGAVGRPHIARAMVEGGYVESVRRAFDHYLGDNGIGRVSRPKLKPVDALEMVHAAGGVGAVAHPRTVKQLDKMVRALADAGLAGIEIYAEKYGPEERDTYRKLAKKYGLIECGGSDYHAFGEANEVQPGMSGPPPDTAQLLYQRSREAHGDGVGFVPDGRL